MTSSERARRGTVRGCMRVRAVRPAMVCCWLLLCWPALLTAQAVTGSCDAPSVLRKVEALLTQQHYAAVQAQLGTLRQCRGLSAMERFQIGWLYGRAHDFRTALEVFGTVDPSVPDLQTHAYAIALGQFELDDYQAAVATLTRLASKTALNADCTNLLAVSYSKLGQYDKAYPLLAGEIEKDPGNLYLYLNLVTLLADAGQFARAEQVANQAVAVFPGKPEVWIVRGAAYTLLGQLDRARSDFAEAVRLAPAQENPRFFLAVTDYKLGNYAQASAGLRAAMHAGVSGADLDYLLAECTLKLDPAQTGEAITELNRAIQLNSRSVPALTLRGKLEMEDGKTEAAMHDLEAAHALDPALRSATYNLARAYFAVGRKNDAQALYQQLTQQSIDAVTELSDQRMKQALAGAAR